MGQEKYIVIQNLMPFSIFVELYANHRCLEVHIYSIFKINTAQIVPNKAVNFPTDKLIRRCYTPQGVNYRFCSHIKQELSIFPGKETGSGEEFIQIRLKQKN